MHASCAPLTAGYALLILTETTLLVPSGINDVNLIVVISSRHLPYLCTQEGVSLGIPSNPMMSLSPCGICLHSLILISQSALSIWLGHTPHGVHKLWDPPCAFNSDSDHQIDNTSHTQPLTSSTFISEKPLHQHVPTKSRHSLRLHAPSTIQHSVYQHPFPR